MYTGFFPTNRPTGQPPNRPTGQPIRGRFYVLFCLAAFAPFCFALFDELGYFHLTLMFVFLRNENALATFVLARLEVIILIGFLVRPIFGLSIYQLILIVLLWWARSISKLL